MKIICLGDSFTEGYLVDKGYTEYLKDAGHQVINLGINGDRTSGMLERFVPEVCDVQIIFGGSNDTFDNISPENIFANPRYEINNRTINELGYLIKSLDVSIVDARKIEPSYIDGLHMRQDFHKKLADEILQAI